MSTGCSHAGDTWRIKGATYRLFGVQACIRGAQFQNAAAGVSNCGETSPLCRLAGLRRERLPQGRIDACLPARPGLFEMCQHIGVEPQ